MSSPPAAPAAFNLDVVPPVVAPEFEVVERSGSFDVQADLTALAGESVRLGVTSDRVVHIVVEQSHQSGSSDDDGSGPSSRPPKESFLQRAVPLPATVDETKVTASFSQGQLKVCLPKRPEHVSAGPPAAAPSVAVATLC